MTFDATKHCGARSKRNDGAPCRGPKVKGGSGRCRMHGGDTSKRPLQPALKHGLYSTVLDPKLRDDYEVAVASVQADNGVGVVEGGVGVRLASMKRYLATHPNGPETDEEREAFYRCLRGIDEGVVVRKTLLDEKPADASFTLTLAQPGSSSVTVRTASGPAVALRAPDGSLLLDDGAGRWLPAVKRIVDDVEIYEPALLEARKESE